jgi:hypothetical protein
MREFVVDEHHAVADEDLIVDGDAFADERVALDLAVFADKGIFLYLDKGADPGTVVDPAAVKIDEFVQNNVFSKFNIRGYFLIFIFHILFIHRRDAKHAEIEFLLISVERTEINRYT